MPSQFSNGGKEPFLVDGDGHNLGRLVWYAPSINTESGSRFLFSSYTVYIEAAHCFATYSASPFVNGHIRLDLLVGQPSARPKIWFESGDCSGQPFVDMSEDGIKDWMDRDGSRSNLYGLNTLLPQLNFCLLVSDQLSQRGGFGNNPIISNVFKISTTSEKTKPAVRSHCTFSGTTQKVGSICSTGCERVKLLNAMPNWKILVNVTDSVPVTMPKFPVEVRGF